MNKFDTLIVTVPNAVLFPTGVHPEGFIPHAENDLRKVLAYSTNNQIGFMVCAVGIGSTLSINGAAAHAVAHIMFKGLLFMAMGAVHLRLGTTKASEMITALALNFSARKRRTPGAQTP